jgi:hypothetical protein
MHINEMVGNNGCLKFCLVMTFKRISWLQGCQNYVYKKKIFDYECFRILVMEIKYRCIKVFPAYYIYRIGFHIK